jgi:hypothetical protein
MVVVVASIVQEHEKFGQQELVQVVVVVMALVRRLWESYRKAVVFVLGSCACDVHKRLRQ